MTQFDYSTLNDKDFELLARDILEVELSLKFRSFKSGKDGGIDLRYSSVSDLNEVIVQVKHYEKSPYSQLKYTLKGEFENVKLLNPKRYIIVTSLELSAIQVNEILHMFDGFILTAQDIIYRQVIDTVLSANENLVKKYYKLWLSSTTVINTILRNDVIGRSKMLFNEIKSYLSLYVQVDEHRVAINKLLDNKVLIITGPPGIGKSTLAKLLLYQLISSGDFELIEVSESLKEASDVIDYNSDRKQVIFFDDFLGANLLEVYNPRNSASSISTFINRIQKLDGKFLIMTSRTTILNQAASTYRKMKYLKYDNAIQHVIHLQDYTRYEKAKILYNHLYFNAIGNEFINAVKSRESYLDIIDHKSYNPRLVEFLTSKSFLQNSNKGNYIDRITEVLKNPEEIWEESYSNNLDEGQRILLQTILSFSGSEDIEKLEEAYQVRLNVQTELFGFVQKMNMFNLSVKPLLGGYLNSQIDPKNSSQKISFANPSIGDFLKNYLSDDTVTRKAIILSCVTMEQLLNLVDYFRDIVKNEVNKDIFLKFVSDNEIQFLKVENKLVSITSLSIWYGYLKAFPNRIEKWVNRNFETSLIYEWVYDDVETALYVIEMLSNYDSSKTMIKKRWEDIIEVLYDGSSRDQHFGNVRNLFEYFNMDYEEWYEINHKIFDSKLSDHFSNQIEYSLENDDFDFQFVGEKSNDFFDDRIVYHLEADLKEISQEILNDNLFASGVLAPGDSHCIELNIDLETVKLNLEAKFLRQSEMNDMDYDRYRDGDFDVEDMTNDKPSDEDLIRNLFE